MILGLNKITCPDCGKTTDELGYCQYCKTVAVSLCPECGDIVWTNDDPGKDYGAEWCSNNNCHFFQNDVMSWEDIKQDLIQYKINK